MYKTTSCGENFHRRWSFIKTHKAWTFILCGAIAGTTNGLLGAGGGMILVPLLTWFTDLRDEEIFPASVCIIAPLCVVSLCITIDIHNFSWSAALPYLVGSAIGGILAGIFAKRIPTKFLHRLLGVLILWGGIRYLC